MPLPICHRLQPFFFYIIIQLCFQYLRLCLSFGGFSQKVEVDACVDGHGKLCACNISNVGNALNQVLPLAALWQRKIARNLESK